MPIAPIDRLLSSTMPLARLRVLFKGVRILCKKRFPTGPTRDILSNIHEKQLPWARSCFINAEMSSHSDSRMPSPAPVQRTARQQILLLAG